MNRSGHLLAAAVPLLGAARICQAPKPIAHTHCTSPLLAKQTSESTHLMSAIGGKADIARERKLLLGTAKSLSSTDQGGSLIECLTVAIELRSSRAWRRTALAEHRQASRSLLPSLQSVLSLGVRRAGSSLALEFAALHESAFGTKRTFRG